MSQGYIQQTSIADGGEFYIRPPEITAWVFNKVKYKELKLGGTSPAFRDSSGPRTTAQQNFPESFRD